MLINFKAVVRPLLGSPYNAVLWPSISFGHGRPWGNFQCSRRCWVRLIMPSYGPPFLSVMDVPGVTFSVPDAAGFAL